MKKVKKELQNTIHECKNTVIITSISVYDAQISVAFKSIGGSKVDWDMCPYCGMGFYELEE